MPLLETKEQSVDDELLTEAIAAQLSHSDGIRGFFVSYLTGGDSDIDKKTVPKPLLNAMKQVENQKDLISLACMNVIMPTAMVTMHTDEELSKSSAMTATRGKIVAGALMNSDEMRRQAMAIVGAASGNVDGCEKDDIKVSKYGNTFNLCPIMPHSKVFTNNIIKNFSIGKTSSRNGVMEKSSSLISPLPF